MYDIDRERKYLCQLDPTFLELLGHIPFLDPPSGNGPLLCARDLYFPNHTSFPFFHEFLSERVSTLSSLL